MNRTTVLNMLARVTRAGLVAMMVCLLGVAHADINGWMGEDPSAANGNARTFALTAKHDFISTSDGNSHYAWGYAHPALPMQYPGPTLIVNQGETVNITLSNALPVRVSMVFPGQEGVTVSGGVSGTLTNEARAVTPGELVAGVAVVGPTYSFVASRPGTYAYHSGTNADLQIEMGLVGTVIVRPTGYAVGTRDSHPARKAYQQPGTDYDRENLFILSEMDPAVHWTVYGQVMSGSPVQVDTTDIRPSIWFINGRNAPDTLLDEFVYWLPSQPYNALPRMHPGERLLMRVVNAGRDLHPFHHHGNHATPIARDARVLSSDPNNLALAPELTSPDFTVRAVPGQTMDLVFDWTGKGIGWDIYGTTADNPHACTPDAAGYHGIATDKNYREWCADHNKPIPVIVAGQLDLSYGESFAGSPFLGLTGSLPQGHPGLNSTGGYFHMWHSHNEKEVTTDDIFPGGMMTMLIIEPWSVDLGDGTSTGGGGGGGGGGNPSLPTVAVLDNFNRANANTLGANWSQTVLLGNASIRVNANQASDVLLAGAAVWNGSGNVFGTKQAAAFTFASATLNSAALMLKASGGTLALPQNFIRVQYNAGSVAVATTANLGVSFTPRGSFATTFANGDRLTAQADATGSVSIWKTSGATTTFVGTAVIPTAGAGAWPQGTGGGRIGISLPANARIDDFAAGSL
jgi:hypothetical protein